MGATNDPTLNRRLREVLRASAQKPVPINPSTWTKYRQIGKLGEFPSQITRQQLGEHCSQIEWKSPHSVEVRRLFAMLMMWGSGKTNGRGPTYTNQALAKDDILDVLVAVHARLEEGDIVAAYNLHRRLNRIGPSFHTKWMWLVGQQTNVVPKPLILDARVWSELRAIGWNSVAAADGERAWGKRYVAYLLACQAWADNSFGLSGGGVTAEDIEFSLFHLAGRPMELVQAP